jgi:transcriptional regulator with XRE-family HTH domain
LTAPLPRRYADSLNDVERGETTFRREENVAKATTFGRAIAEARRAKGLSQKELAGLVEKDEGGAISPTYLNDIEHDRRSPTSDLLIRRFAKALGEEENYLFVLAGKIPDDIRSKATDREAVIEGFANFRKAVTRKS